MLPLLAPVGEADDEDQDPFDDSEDDEEAGSEGDEEVKGKKVAKKKQKKDHKAVGKVKHGEGWRVWAAARHQPPQHGGRPGLLHLS